MDGLKKYDYSSILADLALLIADLNSIFVFLGSFLPNLNPLPLKIRAERYPSLKYR